MTAASESLPRYVIRTRSGDRGPFTQAEVQAFAAAGRLPPTLRIHDTIGERTVLVSTLLAAPERARSGFGPGSIDPAAGLAAGSDTAASCPQPHRLARRVDVVARLHVLRWWLVYGICSLLVVVLAYGLAGQGDRIQALLTQRSQATQRNPVALADASSRGFSRTVVPFLAANCLNCHGPERQKGDVRFDHATSDPADAAMVALWQRASEQLDGGTMPPKGRPRPDATQQAAVIAWMRERILRSAAHSPQPPLRRLTHGEYANAVADLLGVREDLSRLLPDEVNGSEGFPNEAGQLQISTRVVESYLQAAKHAAAEVILPVPSQQWTLRAEESDPMTCDPQHKVEWDHIPRLLNGPSVRYNAVDRAGTLVFYDPYPDPYVGSGVLFSYLPITLPAAGTYRIRLRACAVQLGRTPARVRITYTELAGLNFWESGVNLAFKPFIECNVPGTFADEPAIAGSLAGVPANLPPEKIKDIDPILGAIYQNAPKLVEPSLGIKDIQKWLKNTKPVPAAVFEAVRERATWIECTGRLPAGELKLTINGEDLRDRWLFVPGDLILEGPLAPTHQDPALPSILAQHDSEAFIRYLAGIMSTAYRRTVALEEAATCFHHHQLPGASPAQVFTHAARVSLASVLVSPEFITLMEEPRKDPAVPRRLDGRELAMRLALFLWRGLPDQALLQQADAPAGLAGPAVASQVARMLLDPRLARFINDFDQGWLGLDLFETQLVDPKMFPQAQGNYLRESLRREPDQFMAHLMADDASILELLDSSYVVVNQRLAEYYGLDSSGFSPGDDFRIVRAPPASASVYGVWSGIGPFKAESAHAAFATAFEPEHGIDLAGTCEHGTLHWSRHPDWTDGTVHALPGGDNCAWYMTRTISVNRDHDEVLYLGSDDGFQLWLDGVMVLARDIDRGVAPDQDSVVLHLLAGEHRLLLKVNNAGGAYAFFFRRAGEQGSAFQRGGVLGMGAILMETSQSTRTSPVRRGAWFLQNILGTRPPPPPAKAKDQLARIEAEATPEMSRRQILELHRSNPVCASCHARFDPLGFALENYGPDGLWRSNEILPFLQDGVFRGTSQGPAIDPSGSLSDGRTFEDISGLKRLLIADPRPFVHAFARKLLAFAVGRTLGSYDDASVEAIVSAAYAHHFRIQAVLQAVVACDSFQQH